jgi:hypothetical protein
MSHASPAGSLTIQLKYPTANLGLTELTLTPGLVDGQAREMFLYSQCQLLALALSERTGWPLQVAEQNLPSGQWSWAHAGVRAPSGLWLDIKGPREGKDVTRWLQSWGLPVRLRLLSGATWQETFGLPAGTPLSWWRSRITDGGGSAPASTLGADVVEGFAALLASQASAPGAGGAR